MPSTNSTRALPSAVTAFGLLTREPAPGAFEARTVPQRPNRTIALGELTGLTRMAGPCHD